jgi:hypothetical protein
MASTTNYGWTTPDNTGFVKDGALAIRTLGTSADSTVYTLDQDNLKKTVLDAKGDLIAASANDTPARLAVGSNGQMLVADSTTSTGLRYRDDNAAAKNKIINGDMALAQRGTSISVSSVSYTLDRWFATPFGSGGTYTIAQGTTSAPTNFSNYARVFSNNATLINMIFCTSIETKDVVKLAGKTVTVSFYYRNELNATGTWAFAAYSSTSIDAKAYIGSGTSISGSGVTLSNTATWTRITHTFTVPANATSLGLQFATFNNVVSGAEIQITGVQLEEGAVASAFQTQSGSIGGELALAQRYYTRLNYTNANAVVCGGQSASTTQLYGTPIAFPVQMRVIPSAAVSALTHFTAFKFSPSGLFISSAVTLNVAINSVAFYPMTVATGLASDDSVTVIANTTSAFIEMSAEL